MNPFSRQMEARQKAAILAQRPEPKGSGVVTLRLYDAIDSWGGYWGVSAKEFTATLDELADDTTEIRLLINSPGGEVWEGLAILNALRAHPARVVAVVEGIAASSASFIAAGVDECVMMPNSELFVHNAWGLSVGNAADMSKMARDLTQQDRNIAAIYSAKAGGTVEGWLSKMAEEPFFVGDEAVDVGLADRVEGTATDAAEKAKARFDLSVLARRDSPVAAHGERFSAPKPPDSTEPGTPNRKDEAMAYGDLQAGLRERLGVTDASPSDETLLAALDEALTEQADTARTITVTPVLPDGAQIVDAAAFADLQARAEAGDAAIESQTSDRRDAIIKAAIEDGRIAPASRTTWRTGLDKDEDGTTALLTSLPKNTIPVAETGHSDMPEGSDPLAAAAGWTEEN